MSLLSQFIAWMILAFQAAQLDSYKSASFDIRPDKGSVRNNALAMGEVLDRT